MTEVPGRKRPATIFHQRGRGPASTGGKPIPPQAGREELPYYQSIESLSEVSVARGTPASEVAVSGFFSPFL